MIISYPKPIITRKYFIVFAIAVLLSWSLHEFAHWTMGEFLGYKMRMTLNTSFPLSRSYSSDLDYLLISAAGPIITLLEAILIFILMIQRRRLLLYPFLFTCIYMRLFATIISFRNPNDEARISSTIGMGKFTMPVIMTTILSLLIIKVSQRYQLSFGFNLISTGLVILFSSMIILADMYFKIYIL